MQKDEIKNVSPHGSNTMLGVVFIVTESDYYNESGNCLILKAVKTIENAEKYIQELKSSYKGLGTKIWDFEEVELL